MDYTQLIFYIGAAALMGIAQWGVQSAYKKYSQIQDSSGLTGEEVAKQILATNGIDDVSVILGDQTTLSDYYDPTNKRVRLSSGVFSGNSIASIAVAAHECGHAIQHHTGYKFIAMRNKLLPYANIGGQLGWIAFFFGLMSEIMGLMWIGLAGVLAIGLFQLLTLPIEIDASARAKVQLQELGIVQTSGEAAGVKKMLDAAAFTYIASFLGTVMTILRMVLLMSSSRRRS
ncbi:MAG: zinc metallopeptidase [Erysipelotrichaceae bacterium]|jgi:Zn-dependent membrane protease YugP|nr:zinc metallopeptidase [Erysipelotrichaceae bacterium]